MSTSSVPRAVGLTVSGRVEEFPDDGLERIHIDEKRIVTTDAIEFDQSRVLAHGRQAGRKFTLLAQWKQDIGCHADHERAFEI